jgi:acyl-CoA thioesterase FadM
VFGFYRHDEESVTYNICWTTDLDYFFHMNNGKYFREMDFGRFDFYFRAGFDEYIQANVDLVFLL